MTKMVTLVLGRPTSIRLSAPGTQFLCKKNLFQRVLRCRHRVAMWKFQHVRRTKAGAGDRSVVSDAHGPKEGVHVAALAQHGLQMLPVAL